MVTRVYKWTDYLIFFFGNLIGVCIIAAASCTTLNDTNISESNQYKIEDVIKEGQYVLVQVLKEERGNKGVAMTTYISIAGKYCVLMVNSPERGGVSKKVTNLNDRKILKSILRSLNVSQDKSIILRTAGVGKKPAFLTFAS